MISITPYQNNYHKEIREVFFSAIIHSSSKYYTNEQINAWAPKQYDTQGWKLRIDEIKPNLAWIDNKIVGYADVQQDGYIDHFFVHGDFQGQGIAKALMQQIIQQHNGPRLYSHVSLSAFDFFIGHGFVEVKKQQANIDGVLLTNFLMEKI